VPHSKYFLKTKQLQIIAGFELPLRLMKLAKNVRLLLAISILLCAIGIAVTFYGYREKQQAQFWVDHTNEVIDQSVALLSLYKDAEISERDYLVTSDSAYLHTHQARVREVHLFLAKLRSLTIDNEAQTKLIDSKLIPFINENLTALGENRKAEGGGNLLLLNQRNESIQSILKILTQRERDLLDVRYQRLYSVENTMQWGMFGSLVLVAITCMFAYITIGKRQQQIATLLTTLQKSNDSLEEKVEGQTLALRQSNSQLEEKNKDLAAINEELQASEEEVRSSLEHIKEINRKLEENERHYRLLAENSHDMIFVHRIDGIIEFVSPSIKDRLGFEPAEVIGMLGRELIHPDDLSKIKYIRQRVEGRESFVGTEYRMKTKQGGWLWVEAYIKTMFDHHGEVLGAQTCARDITERKQVEQELREAKVKAEEATVAKSQFLSTMSHEIRTPMNAVIGLTNILIQSDPRRDQLENLNLLRFSGENLLAIINDILDFSKIEAGKVALEMITFNLYELVSNVVEIQKQRANEKNIRLDFSIGETTPEIVVGDPVRISQVLTNLVNNAVKFTEKGYVEVSLDGGLQEGAKHHIRFRVKDTGIGIDTDKLDLIFESFSQANSDTTRRFGGTGLGLAITRKLVEMMDGRIDVESRPGFGSTFIFSLVLEESTIDDIMPSRFQITQAGIQETSIKAKVLLVEDNHVNQIVAHNFLKKWGIDVDFANNGEEALEFIRNKGYDLVLMDLQMPVMDGYTASSRIREMDDPYFKNIPIIALTASAMIEIRQKAFDHGMNDYVSKPFNPDELRSKIVSFVDDDQRLKVRWTDNLNLYTGGDPDFKKELTTMIARNIEELAKAVENIHEPEGVDHYSKTVHKVKTALRFLGDQRFESLVDDIKMQLMGKKDGVLQTRIEEFKKLSQNLLDHLQEEIA
jgi:PAS domain S-box-containing protein